MSPLALLLAAVLGHAAGLACNSPDARLIRRNNLSCRNKQYILDFHNKIRNYVASGRIDGQPKAANMVEMRWSEDLAKLAQTRADTCIFDHGDLEMEDGARVGQNLAIVTSTADGLRLNITQMIELWYNEVFQFGYKGGYEPNSGHYSQLIWGNTREVGCGYTYFEEDHWYKMYFVCDYFPPGNYINQKPYDYDKYDCKKYGLMDSRKYNKLCSVDATIIPVCKTDTSVPDSNGISDVNTTDITATRESGCNSTREDTTELSTEGEEMESEIDGSMEDVEEGFTENSEILDLLTANNDTQPVQGSSGAPAKVTEDLPAAMVTETMSVLNRTMAEQGNELFPQADNQTVFIRVDGDQAIKLDWRSKEDFFRAATKLLELLINRQIALSTDRP